MPVELLSLRRHFGEGHSGWGWGSVDFLLITSLHLDPCLAYKRWIGCEEGFHH